MTLVECNKYCFFRACKYNFLWFLFGFISICIQYSLAGNIWWKIKIIHWREIYSAKFWIFKNNSLAVLLINRLWKIYSRGGRFRSTVCAKNVTLVADLNKPSVKMLKHWRIAYYNSMWKYYYHWRLFKRNCQYKFINTDASWLTVRSIFISTDRGFRR